MITVSENERYFGVVPAAGPTIILGVGNQIAECYRPQTVTSVALETWKSTAQTALDEIAAAHSAVGGQGRGRRYATKEINHAYAILVSSQFQRFCRDLHTESVAHLVNALTPPSLRPVVRARFLDGRKLDRGNPNPGNLGSDFGRLGFGFWDAVKNRNPQNQNRRNNLEKLSVWRNAIAHQDFTPATLDPPPPLRLSTVRNWRSACNGLATEFDRVLGAQLMSLVGTAPW